MWLALGERHARSHVISNFIGKCFVPLAMWSTTQTTKKSLIWPTYWRTSNTLIRVMKTRSFNSSFYQRNPSTINLPALTFSASMRDAAGETWEWIYGIKAVSSNVYCIWIAGAPDCFTTKIFIEVVSKICFFIQACIHTFLMTLMTRTMISHSPIVSWLDQSAEILHHSSGITPKPDLSTANIPFEGRY